MPVAKAHKRAQIDVSLDLVEYLGYFLGPLVMIIGIIQFQYTNSSLPMFWIIYVLIPLLDYTSPLDVKNRTPEEYKLLEKDRRYLIPLYTAWVMEAIQHYMAMDVIYYQSAELSWFELFIFVATLASGAAVGGAVGHELFHRKEIVHKIFGASLYLKMMNTNFSIQHVQGHHKNVATPLDPASADKG